MKKNEIIKLEITAISNNGSGMGRIDNFVVFIPFSAIGDILNVKILKVKTNYAYGKIEEILYPSADRIEPDCAVFGKCGGCDFRHINYESELKIKEKFIEDTFCRIGGLTPEFLPILENPQILDYRNKAQYPVGKDKFGNIVYGFYRQYSHDIIPCDDCRLHKKVFKEIADFIVKYARDNKISVYNEESGNGVIRHIYIRRTHYIGEICLTIVAKRKVPELINLSEIIRKVFPDILSVYININREKTNVILGKNEILLSGKQTISDKICDLNIELSPNSFYQINTPAAEVLYKIAKSFANVKNKTVLDLYCGTGTIGLFMADEALEVIGIDTIGDAIKNAEMNAERNNIKNISFINSDVESGISCIIESGKKIDVVILDPSRKGLEGATAALTVGLSPEKIVMISCNPATAARDCKKFFDLGYAINKVQGVDLFSRTKHVECVVLMSRKEG